MIEYRAYHKTTPRKRGGGKHAVLQKKGKAQESEKMTPVARLKILVSVFLALVVVVLLGAVFGYAYSWMTRSSMFSIRSIEMNPCVNVTKDEIWSIVRVGGKNNIWTVPVRYVSNQLALHPWIRSVSVRKSFPDRFVVRIEEHNPVAMVNLDALWYVDDEGVLFKQLSTYDSKDMAIITGFS
ncbi:MAG: FtsQ-type POTRA domain-containing protein, partial [Syntrophorhabdaceae bacterium]|nr:FtsQ-type POTRA domain-containing protein [Syntrophorhabdaceae bacterium]